MQTPSKHIVIIAGEESGDAHAAELINEAKKIYPSFKFSGIGGRHMSKAGAELVYDLASYGVTGISEVLRHLKTIKKAFTAIKEHLYHNQPDLLILVDYPGFNLRLAKYAKKKLNLKILYYISPQIWAWKANRIHLIKACVDHMAVIFPFEKSIYEKAGVPVSFVGHPLVKKISATVQTREELTLPQNKRIIAILPGSRTHEIRRHMPVIVKTIEQLVSNFSDLHFVLPIAGTVSETLIREFLTSSYNSSVTLIKEKAWDVLSLCDFAVIASGTASLECALSGKPMCIIYKSSFLTYLAASKLIKINYLGISNILSNRMISPEFLQYDCNAEALSAYISKVLQDEEMLKKMTQKIQTIPQSLSANNADCTLLELMENELKIDGNL